MRAAALAALLCSLPFTPTPLAQTPTTTPSFPYDVARAHEIKPHRRTIPLQGVHSGFSQLTINLLVSPGGEVLDAKASGSPDVLKFWPQLQAEVDQWKFTPFEIDGKPVTARIEEYIDLVPPERLPKSHIPAPALTQTSDITITLRRSGCLGSCPAYILTVTTKSLSFEGQYYVVALGNHTAAIDPDAVRALTKKFIAADFYSMDNNYVAGVTDCPTYQLTLSIDGHSKQLTDYVGEWVGMPQVITELEEDVDTLANSDRWIKGTDGLVPALQAEHFNFQTYDAQVILKSASANAEVATVQQLLAAGVPLTPFRAPKPANAYSIPPFSNVGWLTAASESPEVLQMFIDARASVTDQSDKDAALSSAARSGKVAAARALIAYGANPNADLSKLLVSTSSAGFQFQGPNSGSILLNAASSGKPDMVREILKYHPNLETRDVEGKTAIFIAGNYLYTEADGARAECVRLLANAGANVNARDRYGNTPLHETFLTDVQEELLKRGADVNARNNNGETPIFTTEDPDSIPLFIKYGADLTLRNNKGQTIFEASSTKGPVWQAALRAATQQQSSR